MLRWFRSVLALLLVAAPLAAQVGYQGFNPEFMDATTPAAKDFFQHAVGKWLDTTPIPADYSRYGVDEEVDQRTFKVLKDILETAARNRSAPVGSETRKLGDFYAAGMDLDAIEQAGVKPLAKDFAGIQAVRDRSGLAREIAALHRRGCRPAFRFCVDQDDKDSTRMVATFAQGGLGLPDRDYYLRADAGSLRLRAQYAAHVARMFGLLGEAPALAERHAGVVLAMETRLAAASMDRAERRDPDAVYHLLTPRGLATAAEGMDWDALFQGLGLNGQDPVLVRQPAFFKELGVMVQTLPLPDWQTYLRWQLILDTAPFLSSRFEQADFDFFHKTLCGTQEQHPRWKRMLMRTDDAMGEILGKFYVERAFPPEAKARMLAVVANLRAALADRIRQLPWMSPPTKALALAKLDAMVVKIGYPDVWRDYSALTIDRHCHVGNVLAARAFDFDQDLARLGRPVDRSEWSMTPITNNACYCPNTNDICFPAGILQPPYFDLQADDAVIYGNIGATIGHEMTHAFDDHGRKYDAQGNLKDWWTPADVQAFQARTALMVRQFDAYEPLPGLHINGKASLGENIADLGGLKIAYDAFRKAQEGKPALTVCGFTPDQRFFLGYAETWRTKVREEALRERVLTDCHAPAKFRVNGPLSNMPEFYQAFDIQPGSAMYRPESERPVIW